MGLSVLVCAVVLCCTTVGYTAVSEINPIGQVAIYVNTAVTVHVVKSLTACTVGSGVCVPGTR